MNVNILTCNSVLNLFSFILLFQSWKTCVETILYVIKDRTTDHLCSDSSHTKPHPLHLVPRPGIASVQRRRASDLSASRSTRVVRRDARHSSFLFAARRSSLLFAVRSIVTRLCCAPFGRSLLIDYHNITRADPRCITHWYTGTLPTTRVVVCSGELRSPPSPSKRP